MIKIGKILADVSETTLQFFRQMGVEAVNMPTQWNEDAGAGRAMRPLVPPARTGPPSNQIRKWDEEELRRIRARIEAFDLVPSEARLGITGNILLGLDGRDDDLDVLRTNIEIAGRVGIGVLTYSFTALRASEGYGAIMGGGRGGSNLRDFDYDRIKDLPPYDSVGSHSNDVMWDRLTYFLKAVIPTAENAGVKLAVHPNDPPVPVYRGVAQPLGDMDGMKRLIEVVDSPSNCLYFDTGVTTEKGADAAEMIRYFGYRNRIAAVHFRNVRVEVPRFKYVEVFHDEGDCGMFACMKAFHEVGYEGLIDPDHTPGVVGDTADSRMGWAFAIGQIVALRNAVETNP